jgi:hypothetical protein
MRRIKNTMAVRPQTPPTTPPMRAASGGPFAGPEAAAEFVGRAMLAVGNDPSADGPISGWPRSGMAATVSKTSAGVTSRNAHVGTVVPAGMGWW